MPVSEGLARSLETLKSLVQSTMEQASPRKESRDREFNRVLEYIESIIEQARQNYNQALLSSLEQDAVIDKLTRRERQVLKLVASGYANKNIASELNISIRTAEAHRANLTKKLGIKTTAGLVKFAMAQGMV